MHKRCNIVFAVLRDERPFVRISSQEHRQNYLFIPFSPSSFLQNFPVHLLTFLSWTLRTDSPSSLAFCAFFAASVALGRREMSIRECLERFAVHVGGEGEHALHDCAMHDQAVVPGVTF